MPESPLWSFALHPRPGWGLDIHSTRSPEAHQQLEGLQMLRKLMFGVIFENDLIVVVCEWCPLQTCTALGGDHMARSVYTAHPRPELVTSSGRPRPAHTIIVVHISLFRSSGRYKAIITCIMLLSCFDFVSGERLQAPACFPAQQTCFRPHCYL